MAIAPRESTVFTSPPFDPVDEAPDVPLLLRLEELPFDEVLLDEPWRGNVVLVLVSA